MTLSSIIIYFAGTIFLFNNAPEAVIPDTELPGEVNESVIPSWVLEDWKLRTSGEGIWIADNSAYQSDVEPFEAYGLKWTYGIGRKHLTGELFLVQDGQKVGTAWSFKEFWDPEGGQLSVIQIGADGTVGKGSIIQDDQGRLIEEQVFTQPGGNSFSTGHHTWVQDGAIHTQSFEIVDGIWTKNRYYEWSAKKTQHIKAPEYFKNMEFLIGEWNLSLDKERIVKMRFDWAENKRLIKYQGTNPGLPNTPETLETEGVIVFNGVDNQIQFLNAYMSAKDDLISKGTYSFPGAGTIVRRFTCYYGEGEVLPWSDGALAPKGGKNLEFKQIWKPIDEGAFTGDFYWLKDGNWVPPIKKSDDQHWVWRKVATKNGFGEW